MFDTMEEAIAACNKAYTTFRHYNKEQRERTGETVSRKLIIDGNAVYEIDEECMLKRRLNGKESREASQREEKTKNQADKNAAK